MKEFKVGEHTYQSGRLSAMQQFHVARRLAPMLQGIGQGLRTVEADPVAMFGPIAEALSSMSDVDAEYIVNLCLDACTRQQTGGWAKVRSQGGIMFPDIQMPQMLQICWHVLQDNLGNFIDALPEMLPGEGLTLKA